MPGGVQPADTGRHLGQVQFVRALASKATGRLKMLLGAVAIARRCGQASLRGRPLDQLAAEV
jgi:hypothetical protein